MEGVLGTLLSIMGGEAIDMRGSDDGKTAIGAAARDGRATNVARLVAAGADPNIPDLAGRTPLHDTARTGRVDVMDALLRSRAVALDRYDARGETAIYLAAHGGHTNAVSRLLLAGADPCLSNAYGRTPLHAAAERNCGAVVRTLLDAGVDKNRSQIDGKTALHLACAVGSEDATNELLIAAVDFERSDQNGDTALHLAASYGHARIVRMLLRAGASAVRVNASGLTPLYSAVERRRGDVIKTLLSPSGCSYGASVTVNTATFARRTPLLCAVEQGDLTLVETLLEHGANPRMALHDGTTPLHIAAAGRGPGNPKITSLLLAYGALVVSASHRKYAVRPIPWLGEPADCHASETTGGWISDPKASGPEAHQGPNAVSDSDSCSLGTSCSSDGFAAKQLRYIGYPCGRQPAHMCEPLVQDRNAQLLRLPARLDGTTPLMLAAQAGNTEIAAMIATAAPWGIGQCRTTDGATPLAVAAAANDVATLRVLISAGALPHHPETFSGLFANTMTYETALTLIYAGAAPPLASPFASIRCEWSIITHNLFSARFRRAIKTVLLCNRRPESPISVIPRSCLFTIFEFFSPLDF